MKCLNCGNERFVEKKIRCNPSIKGEVVEVIVPSLVCLKCNAPFMDSEQMNVLRKAAADKYRELHGLLTSAQIVSYRDSLGMSQIAFARYLNVGEASIKRWETYYIQDSSQDELICLKCDEAIAEVNFLNIYWKRSKPDSFNGNRKFSFELFKNVALYLVKKTKVSLMYLNKIHFYVDFLHFRNFGNSITGARYTPLKLGPCPDQYRLLYDTLVAKGYLKEKKNNEYILLKEPDLTLFDDYEIETLEQIVSFCKKRDKKTIFDLSHEEEGYIKTDETRPIDYKFAKNIKLPF